MAASFDSSRTVILLPGSGSPLELAKGRLRHADSRAACVIVGEAALIAGIPRQHNAGIIAAVDDRAGKRSSTEILLWMPRTW